MGRKEDLLSNEELYSSVTCILERVEEKTLLDLLEQEQLASQMKDLACSVLVKIYLSTAIKHILNKEQNADQEAREVMDLFARSKEYYNRIIARDSRLNHDLNHFVAMQILALQEKVAEFSETTFAEILSYLPESSITGNSMYNLQDGRNILKARAAGFLLEGG